jgi:sec-independent protein translocase protein TatB
MSFPDTVVLFILALLLFGPKKLPEIARQIGKALNEFKRASNEFKAQIEAEISQLELEERRKQQAPQEFPKLEAAAESVPAAQYLPPQEETQPGAASQDVNSPAHSTHA